MFLLDLSQFWAVDPNKSFYLKFVFNKAWISFSNNLFNFMNFFQCVCSWEDRDKMFIEVEAIIRRQIKVQKGFAQVIFLDLHLHMVSLKLLSVFGQDGLKHSCCPLLSGVSSP